MATTTVRLSGVYMQPELAARLRAEVERTERPVSWIVRKALTQHLINPVRETREADTGETMSVRLSAIYVDTALADRLQAEQERTGASASEVVRLALDQYLPQDETSGP